MVVGSIPQNTSSERFRKTNETRLHAYNDLTIHGIECRHFGDMASSSIFLSCFFSLVKFSHWSKFHVNIITGSEVMIIFFYKGLTKNSEIPPSEFRPISGDSGELEIPNLERMSLMKCY